MRHVSCDYLFSVTPVSAALRINDAEGPLPLFLSITTAFSKAMLYVQLMNESEHFSHPLTHCTKM